MHERDASEPPAQNGALWPLDRYGRARNAGDRRRISAEARSAAAWVTELLQDRLGPDLHSVYLTGDGARGRPGPLAFLALRRMAAGAVKNPASADDPEPLWLAEAVEALQARSGDVGPASLHVREWRDVFPPGQVFSVDRFRLGVASVCIHGRDVTRHIAPQRLSHAAANAWIIQTRKRIDAAAGRLALASQADDVRREARLLGRFLCAAAFALVMPAEGVYTEDPDVQRDLFALNHPRQAREIGRACAFIRRPPDAAYELLHLLDGFGRWLTAECDAWLDAHNPSRRIALPL